MRPDALTPTLSHRESEKGENRKSGKRSATRR